MFVKITVLIDGREAGVAEHEISGTAAELEEQTRVLESRVGRMILEPGLQEISRQMPTPCCCGRRMKNCGFRTIGVLTTCGEIPVSRRRYRCGSCGRESYPADAQICCGRHRLTRPLAMRVCQLATVEHFPHLPQMLSDQHGVTLGHETIVELVHDVGSNLDRIRKAEAQNAARKWRTTTPAMKVASPPQRIYISVDGAMYCTNQTEPDPLHPGQRRLIWQQMKVGCIYWQDAKDVWHKQILWGRESPEEFGLSLWRLARECGYQQATERIFASDGGAWCWDIHRLYFSDAAGILDWYHASEHIWEAARIVSPGEFSNWADAALQNLRENGGTGLLSWLIPQIALHRGKVRVALESLRDYVATKVESMNYSDYRQRGWQIGTGMVESTCKQLVGVRLKGPGMHWTEQGAIAITALKATDLNGHWKNFWKSLVMVT